MTAEVKKNPLSGLSGLTGLKAQSSDLIQDAPPAQAPDPAPEINPLNQTKIWTSPIKKFKIGKFRFQDGRLQLSDPVLIQEFESTLERLPVYERVKIKTISLDLANQIATKSLGRATKGFDSGVNREFEEINKSTPKIGTQDLGKKESGN